MWVQVEKYQIWIYVRMRNLPRCWMVTLLLRPSWFLYGFSNCRRIILTESIWRHGSEHQGQLKVHGTSAEAAVFCFSVEQLVGECSLACPLMSSQNTQIIVCGTSMDPSDQRRSTMHLLSGWVSTSSALVNRRMRRETSDILLTLLVIIDQKSHFVHVVFCQ